jgi:hypothetical protein
MPRLLGLSVVLACPTFWPAISQRAGCRLPQKEGAFGTNRRHRCAARSAKGGVTPHTRHTTWYISAIGLAHLRHRVGLFENCVHEGRLVGDAGLVDLAHRVFA